MLFFLLILAVLQGITEFLPISSSGHLALFQNLSFFKEYKEAMSDSVMFTYDVLLHLATFLSILIFFRKEVAQLISGFVRYIMGNRAEDTRFAFYLSIWIVLSNIPIAVIGIIFKSNIEALFHTLTPVAIFFIVNGFILLSTRYVPETKTGLFQISLRQAMIVGLVQTLALLPGISRSGSTIFAGLWAGIAPKDAARFSFLLGLPAVGGAALLEIINVTRQPQALTFGLEMILGMVVAFITGLLSLQLLVWIVQKARLYPFGLYTIVLGIAILIFF